MSSSPDQHSKAYLKAALILVVCCVSQGALADTVSATISSPLKEDTILGNSAEPSGGYGWNEKRPIVGQTFIAENDMTVSRIVLPIWWADKGASGAPFTLRLYRFGSSSSGVPNEPPIFSGEGSLPARGLVKGADLTLEIQPTELKKDQVYGFVLTFTEPQPGLAINFAVQYENSYPGGSILTAASHKASKLTPVNMDFNFSLLK